MTSAPVRFLLVLSIATSAAAQDWGQFARSAQHDAAMNVVGRSPDVITSETVIDPFVDQEMAASGRSVLLVHYPVPLVDGDDLFLLEKGGQFTALNHPETQTWSVKNVRRAGSALVPRWKVETDWKPVPISSGEFPSWEQMYQPAMTSDFVYAPAGGATILKLNRSTGAVITRLNPFGTIDPTIYTAGPPTIDAAGNIFYNAMKLDAAAPYGRDVVDSWLVRIAADGTIIKASYNSLVPNAPLATDLCPTTLNVTTGLLQTTTCGSQRPGVNVAPAVAPDGTIYSVTRAHFTSRTGFVIAVNPNLTPKWSTSMRNRFADGCGVLLPRTNSPTGCKTDSPTGVDPADNQLGSGRVNDNSTSSPAVAPDGNVLYGAYSSYNFAQGHLMSFSAGGAFLASYPWGWDFTPSIWKHDNSYSLVMKENHYAGDEYYVVQLNPSLNVEWKFKSTETKSCSRAADGTLQCVVDHPGGFEWCVNAIAIDANGTAYANSEDGFLYAINQGGTLRSRVFLRLALGAAYTPLAIGRDGSVYTQNAGRLYVTGDLSKRTRTARH